MLRAKQVDGLIIFPTGNNRELYQRMLDEKYPVVFLDRSVPDIPVSSIMLENEVASELAVDHFIEKNHSRIGLITTSIIDSITPRLERLEGYQKALEKHGIAINDDYISSVAPEEIQVTLDQMLSQKQPPEAILAGNDLVLMEILKYVKQKGLRIPEDLAIIGIDDVSFASFYTPTITTVAQPTFKMGKMSADLLLNKIKQNKIRDDRPDYRFKPTLMIRESV